MFIFEYDYMRDRDGQVVKQFDKREEGHTVQSITEEVLLADLDFFHTTWDFLVPMDLSRPPCLFFVNILKKNWREIQKSQLCPKTASA